MSRKCPNLLANQSGEGAPIAPDGWGWRAGTRKQDMYFTAPSGEVFRSRCRLNNFLKTMRNSPSQDSFCWSITEGVLHHPALQFAVPESALQRAESAIAASSSTRVSKSRKNLHISPAISLPSRKIQTRGTSNTMEEELVSIPSPTHSCTEEETVQTNSNSPPSSESPSATTVPRSRRKSKAKRSRFV
ncbi:hypothetical protein Mapa_013594 [Marchantia paleacea]|nr:hypothetical protein Mapa_013594 [Marchantia paleacea]